MTPSSQHDRKICVQNDSECFPEKTQRAPSKVETTQQKCHMFWTMHLAALYHDYHDGVDSSSDAQEQTGKNLMNQASTLRRRPIIVNEDSLPKLSLTFRNSGAEWILWIHRYSFDVFVMTLCMVAMIFVLPFLESIFDVDDDVSVDAELGLLMATKRLKAALGS